jgi:hypothetical protein
LETTEDIFLTGDVIPLITGDAKTGTAVSHVRAETAAGSSRTG